MPVSVKVTVKAARRQRHMSSGWLRKAAQHVDSAADAARAKEKAKLEAVAFGLDMHPPIGQRSGRRDLRGGACTPLQVGASQIVPV